MATTSPDKPANKPIHITQDKENDQSTNRDHEWEWRGEDSKQEVVRTRGISPKSFHTARTRQRPGQAAVQELHCSVQSSILKHEKCKLIERHEIQRSAYRQVTSLRTWPLQERALRHLRELDKVYMHTKDEEEVSDQEHDKVNTQTEAKMSSESSASSSCTSSSLTSIDEPKRVLRDRKASPAKSRLKVQFREEFLEEQALSKPLPVDFSFGCALWSMEPRIFSVEKSDKGKRKYIVGHLGRFLDLYWRKTDPNHRCYYELIREKTPCRLYLDLEYTRECNPIPQDHAEGFLEELLIEISNELTEQFGLEAIDRSNVVDLDSSTEKKFSRHWIFHLPGGALFAHTAALGYFMQQLVGRLADEQATGQLVDKRPLLHKYLFVNVSNSDKQTCFIDLGVYTRNRLFRLMGSSKYGKPASAALRIAETNQFPFPLDNDSFYLPALKERLRNNQSLADDDDSDDDLDAAVKRFVAATDWTSHADAMAQTLVVPVNASKIDFPILPFDESLLQKTNKSRTAAAKTNWSSSLLYGESPYPCIDRFVVETLGARGGVQGSIRAWSMERDADQVPLRITYQMKGNRWCECIGRAHKSNGIYWIVDLRLWHCVQYCHDPDCRAMGFRGTPVSLPSNVRQAVEETIFEEQLARLDESQLLAQIAKPDAKTHHQSGDETVEKSFASLRIDEEKNKRQGEGPGETTSCAVVTQDASQTVEQNDDSASNDKVDLAEQPKLKDANLKTTCSTTEASGNVDGTTDTLSDDVLWEAVLSNPELFP